MTSISTPASALAYLKSLPNQCKTKVCELYDTDDCFGTALRLLLPNFEYPNYSYKTVQTVIKEIESKAL